MVWVKPENPKFEAYYGGTSGSIFEHEVGDRLPGIIRQESYLDKWIVNWRHQADGENLMSLMLLKEDSTIRVICLDPHIEAIYDYQTGLLKCLEIGMARLLGQAVTDNPDNRFSNSDLKILGQMIFEEKEVVFVLPINMENTPCAFYFQEYNRRKAVGGSYYRTQLDMVEVTPTKGYVQTEIKSGRFEESFWLVGERDCISLGVNMGDSRGIVGTSINRQVDFSKIIEKIYRKEKVNIDDLDEVVTEVSPSLQLLY